MSQRVVGPLALLCLAATAASAPQPGLAPVSYDVEFTTTGALMSGSAACASPAGIDKLSGTITGQEPADAHHDNRYSGTLIRDTNVTFCYVATRPNAPDQAYNCSVNIKGRARVPVEFDLLADGRGGYLRAQDTSVVVSLSSVTGTCDQAEMAEWQRDYGTMSTAGSPDGQPIDIPALPRTGPYPIVFAPGASGTASPGDVGTWTLKVLGRRP